MWEKVSSSRWSTLVFAIVCLTIAAWVFSGYWATTAPGPTYNVMDNLSPKSPVSHVSGSLLLMTVLVNQDASGTAAVACSFSSDCNVSHSLEPFSSGNVQQQRDTSDANAATYAARQSGVEPQFTVAISNVGGPSAGLVSSLALTAAQTGTVPVPAGETVAVTGTVDPAGNVGPVGGVGLKALAAVRDGASVFLVPVGEVELADDIAEGALTVVGVETVSQAWGWLCANGAYGPLCEPS